ncbi:MAG: aconitase X catalytic domain-containing protein [Acidimicrobiia bacterium]|nr:MAG: aconitase X catalytic domain-containing protein [Acidimicrobiia bacterium]
MLDLTDRDQAFLKGEFGAGAEFAMRIIVRTAGTMGATHLLDIVSAHVDSCIYNGMAGLDFAERLRDGGAHVSVPTTLNVASLDLLHPELNRLDEPARANALRLVDAYVDMGGSATWTCAPYQLTDRPRFGDQIAWAESNAIVFANSVLGARTNRYGDFIDISCAITGRVPAAGFHLDEGRTGSVLYRLVGLPDDLLNEDVFYPVLGHFIGLSCGSGVPVIDGLPRTTTEDQLKALGASAASSGSVALFHALGVTPEATSIDAVCPPGDLRHVDVTPGDIAVARDHLTTRTDLPLRAIAIGTPHLSIDGFGELIRLLDGHCIHDDVEFYVSTARDTLAEVEARGWLAALDASGVTAVTDTCTYVTPIIRHTDGVVMTDSGKWAWYAPGNLGVHVAFGSTAECVRSARAGRIVRDPGLWHGI